MSEFQVGNPGSDSSSMGGDPQRHFPDQELRDLQRVELSILREFVRVCDAHELRYYLAYGTLLGAIRHGGFIPWDDDIDVTMPRDDYNRFAKLCASALQPGFEWLSYATEQHYPHWFGKVIKTDTVFRQARTERLSFPQSVYIDVFPLDGLADRPMVALIQRVLFRVCRLRLGVDVKRTVAKRLLVQLIRLVPRRSAILIIEAISRRFPIGTATRWICVGGPYGHRRQSFERRWFGTGALLSFHDLRVVGPAAWDEYLTHVYGDYMTPPPLALRKTDHLITELQLERGGVARTSLSTSTSTGRHDEAHADY